MKGKKTMVKDIVKIGKENVLSNFTKLEIENILKDLLIEDVYSMDILKDKDTILELIEVLSVSLVALKGQNTLLQEKLVDLMKKK